MYPGPAPVGDRDASSGRASLHKKNGHLQVLSKRANVDVLTQHASRNAWSDEVDEVARGERRRLAQERSAL